MNREEAAVTERAAIATAVFRAYAPWSRGLGR